MTDKTEFIHNKRRSSYELIMMNNNEENVLRKDAKSDTNQCINNYNSNYNQYISKIMRFIRQN